MRITGGALRGRRIVVPNVKGVRPTTDMVRQAIFNILSTAPAVPSLAGLKVLDLFAGSGALGFEALSRGASFVTFIEKDSNVIRALRENASNLGLNQQVEIVAQDALSAVLNRPRYDLVFMDPPYGSGVSNAVINHLRNHNLITSGTTIVVEQSHSEIVTNLYELTYWFERIYGRTKINILTFG
jgi:16S rRNA (guanine966-N2)-methyltransferase